MLEHTVFEAYRQPSDRLPQAIGFRPINDSDLPFLATLYATTRAEEMAMVNWDTAQKESFLQMQFEAQHQHYQQHFTAADFLIIQQSSDDDQPPQPIGRVYVDRRCDEIRLIDIALMPDTRNSGLGTQLLLDLLDEARQKALPVRIHVEQFNPAMRLYQRLGFQVLEDQGIYQFMEWHPQNSQAHPNADNRAAAD